MAASAVAPQPLPRTRELVSKPSNLTKEAMPLVVSFTMMGNTRRVPTSHVETQVQDKTMIKVHKLLLDSEELRNIKRHDWDTMGYVNSVCLPFPGLKGARLAPRGLVAEICEELDARIKHRKELVKTFAKAYPMLLERASAKLGPEFNRRDYPKPEYVAGEFSMDYQFVSYGVPGQLEEISNDIFKHETKKAQRVLRDAVQEGMYTLRTMLSEMVTHLSDRLADDEKRTGKPKRFRDSAVTNLTEFLDRFDKLNVVHDGALEREVKKARQLLKGVTPDGLRTTDTVREAVRIGMEKISANVGNMIKDAPGRRFLTEE